MVGKVSWLASLASPELGTAQPQLLFYIPSDGRKSSAMFVISIPYGVILHENITYIKHTQYQLQKIIIKEGEGRNCAGNM